jgi:hypothetical protein
MPIRMPRPAPARTRQIEELPPSWSMAPVVTALQAMRGVALFVALTIAAEGRDPPAGQRPTADGGLFESGAFGTFAREQHRARWYHPRRQSTGGC